jgi:hypothetical protein
LYTNEELTANLGSVTATGTANISITGQALTAAEGTATLDALTPVDVTGFDLTMQEDDVTAITDVTCISNRRSIIC